MNVKQPCRRALIALMTVPLSFSIMAATTDLATAPLITSSSVSVLPNLMFVLDDSGSMDRTYMPDEADSFDEGSVKINKKTTITVPKYGYPSSQCNQVYYDPTITYSPPLRSDGTSYPDALFTAAWNDGFNPAVGTPIDLSDSFVAFSGDTSQPAYYYNYTGTQTTAQLKKYTDNQSAFYLECDATDYTTTKPDNVHVPKELFTKVQVSGVMEQKNFANWYSYYRTRMLMMKTAVGMAFNPVDSSFRVGFMKINDSASVSLAPFDSAQKKDWYDKLYAASPSGSTPLREALANVGRLYAGKRGTDPIQYSCQQNFTILSTDGYWNGYQNGSDADVKDLSGANKVVNTDSNITTTPRPFYDGGISYSPTLADVAQYYYATDLRTSTLGNCTGKLGAGVDVCANNVPASADDNATWQHMTTFTLGLGAPGRMVFSPSYMSDTSGDYYSVKTGVIASSSSICSWQKGNNKACNWPNLADKTLAGEPEAIDDLWHAAVNGRGAYFSATNATSLAVGLQNALAGVSARVGSSAAAAASNPNVTSGDNFVFSSSFTSQDWTGNLVEQQIDPLTGVLQPTILWSAQSLLDAKSSRTIYTYDSGSHALKPFAWGSLSSTEQGNFNLASIKTLSQFCTTGVYCLPASAQSDAAGAKLVSYLAGDRTYEGTTDDLTKYYRMRKHVLGDIVDSEAAYVKKTQFAFADAGYADYTLSVVNRAAMIYVGANDGMLHAFSAEGGTAGQEMWAYVPSFLFPNLYKLADKNYGNQHQFYVDGTPIARDVYFEGAWHTILVGGMNNGGRGYYALDVTNPAAPRALWEFTDANLGYTYGNPVMAKLKDGTWVVIVSSGYNNVSPGDGMGHLYVLNAQTGALIRDISTGAGSATTPSGLAKLTAWMANAKYDYTALRVYGGDLLGNVWRFDINGDIGVAGYDAQLLATLKDASGNAQPVTTRPELGEINGISMVYVGTGSLLGVTDLNNTKQQSFYAIKDPMGSKNYGDPRTDSLFVQQALTVDTCPTGTPTDVCTAGQTVRLTSATPNPVDLNTKHGWYVDLPDSGERVNTDPLMSLGMISLNSNVPSTTACTLGGLSYRYFLDARSGSFVTSINTRVAAVSLGSALANRPILIQLSNGKVSELIQTSDGKTSVLSMPKPPVGKMTRRVSWRELPTE